LTIREIEIIQLLATDKSDKMVADELGISTSTLDTHKKHLFEKAGVFSKSGLIFAAIDEKIVQ
jgi:DNA-binding CsgD family transcriptional regulator